VSFLLLSQLLERVECLAPCPAAEVTGITGDSRKVSPGDVFVCISGAKTDGHAYAAAAVAAGAVAVVAERDTGLPGQVLVRDSHTAYSLMCAAFFGYPAERLQVIGVTGTNGKTTTCFLLKEILDHAGFQTGLIGTVRNMIGSKQLSSSLTTPDAFELQSLFAEMLRAGCSYCVMEVSSQALAQGRVGGVEFRCAAFTNLSEDHLDYHGTIENYLAAKQKLFSQTATAVVNLDDAYSSRILEACDCPVTTFSAERDEADFTAKSIRTTEKSVEYVLVGKSLIGRVHFPVPGLFSVYNSMCACVCALELGVGLDTVLQAISASAGVPGRMEVLKTGTPFAVIIDYAHTPDGLEKVLGELRSSVSGKLIAVFGCGGDRDKKKRPMMGKIAFRYSDTMIVTSDNPRSEDPASIIADIIAEIDIHAEKPQVIIEADRTRAIATALTIAGQGDAVLLAGKGHETYQILNSGRIDYDEREKVSSILEQLHRGGNADGES